MICRVVRHRDLVPTPWKNGGGTTIEIAAEPPGSGFSAFDWRISMADVVVDGPFSIFAGVDRTLALVEGAALDIDIDGRPHRLGQGLSLVRFAGEASTGARLPAGPVRDLNVMTRRASMLHRLRFAGQGGGGDPSPVTMLVVVALDDRCEVQFGDSEIVALDRFDAAIVDHPPARWRASRTVVVIELWRS